MVTFPTKPLHSAKPLAFTLGVAGAPESDGFGPEDMGIGIGVAIGLPMLHTTGGDVTVIGAMLKVPVAVNWTIPPAKLWASAEAGVTVRLCICRLEFIIMFPPQPATRLKRRRREVGRT